MFYQPGQPHGLRHNPFKSLVVPRPIGWISTVDRAGVVNLAPYSFFNALASDPPVVVFGPGGRHVEGGLKDTPRNIAETGEFVVNVVTWDLREAMNRTSGDLPRAVDELALAGLTPAPSRLVKPPGVGESPARLECVHLQTVTLPSDDPAATNLAILGRVVGIHIDEAIVADGLIDMTRFRPIARLGYHDYTTVDNVFTMRRPG